MSTKAAQFATEAQANSVADAIDTALGFPRRGTNIGDGRHVTVQDAWDGTGALPLGWTLSFAEVHTAPGKDPVVPLDDSDAALVAAALSALAPADQALVAAALAARAAIDLDANGYAPKRRPPRPKLPIVSKG